MCSSTTEPPEDGLAVTAKAITDLEDLVNLVGKGLSRAKPWARHLAAQLLAIDRLLLVLRMTIAMSRPEDEIFAAANSLRTACCKADLAVAGSRADLTTRAAMRLAIDLSVVVCEALDLGEARTS